MADREKLPMMKCGHTANGYTELPGGERKPCCVICAGLTPNADEIADETPNLEGRLASCSCGKEVPSNTTLPFFRHRETAEKDDFYCGCYGWDQKVGEKWN